MFRSLSAFVVCLTFLTLGQANSAFGQAGFESKGIERDGDLQMSVGLGFGAQGAYTQTDVKLVNELGVAYDTYSLISRPAIREAVGIDEQQHVEMHELHQELVNEIKDKMIDLMQENGKEDFEARFLEVEAQLTESLTTEQVEQMNQIMIQQSVKQFGLEKVLQTKHIQEKLGLNEDEIRDLSNVKDLSNQISKAQYAVANERLLEELTASQVAELKGFFEDFEDEFMAVPLFEGKNQKAFSERVTENSLWQAVRNRKLREHLKLTDEQTSELNELRRNLAKDEDAAEAITGVFTEEQKDQFRAVVARKQTERWGTTRAVANGYLSRLLEIDDAQSERLIELGQELHEELKEKIYFAKVEGVMELLSRSRKEQIKKLMGELNGIQE